METTQDTPTDLKDVFQHQTNYICARWTCTRCQWKPKDDCELCRDLSDISTKGRAAKGTKKPAAKKQKLETGNFSVNAEPAPASPIVRKRTWNALEDENIDPMREFVRWILCAFDDQVPTFVYAHAGGVLF